MSLEERDDATRRKVGWPSVSEQKAYWDHDTTLQAISNTLKALTMSVEGLLEICKDQQKQIDTLKRK